MAVRNIKREKRIDSMTRLRVMRLLEEAKSRVSSVTYQDMPLRLVRRAQTIENKLTDLVEDVREVPEISSDSGE